MKKKVITILVILLLLFAIMGTVIVRVAKDFGISNLGKSIIALYKVKLEKDTDYVKISEDAYLVKNKQVRQDNTFINEENNMDKQIIKTASFCIYKDNMLYSFVRIEDGK